MGRGRGRGGGQREERGEEQRGGGGGHGGVSLGTECLHLLSPPYPGPGPSVVTEVALSAPLPITVPVLLFTAPLSATISNYHDQWQLCYLLGTSTLILHTFRSLVRLNVKEIICII